MTIIDVLGRELGSCTDRLGGIAYAVVGFVATLEPHQDASGVIDSWLDNIDLLEATGQRTVFLEDLGVLLISGGSHTAEQTIGEQRLDQVGRIQLTTGCRTGTNDGMDLVDKEDGPFLTLNLLEQYLEALLEIPTVFGARQQRPHIQRIDGTARNHLGHIAFNDTVSQPFGNGGFTHARFTHQQRVVLATAAEHLNGTVELLITTNQRIDAPFQHQLVQVGGKTLDLGGRNIIIRLGIVIAAEIRLAVLAHPVGEEIDDVETADLGFFQEIGSL